MDNSADIKKSLHIYRREFNTFPEVGWTEFRTTSRIAEELVGFGYKVILGKDIHDINFVMGRPNEHEIKKHIQRALTQGASSYWIDKMEGYTGAIAVMDTRIPGPSLAFRFDIDANDIEVAKHCCGHDGHIAIGIVLAKEISKILKKGKVTFIFQPAEEGVRGAKSIVAKSSLKDVDFFVSGHIGLGLKSGEVMAVTEGFLCTTKIDAIYTGKPAHAGIEPNEGNNSLLAAATAVLNLHGIAPHKDGAGRINVGHLISGGGRNIIPSGATVKLETRGENNTINTYFKTRAIDILAAAAAMHNQTIKIDIVGEAECCKSDFGLIKIAAEAAEEVQTIEIFRENGRLNASEDASLMINYVQNNGGKALYVVFGTELKAGHHHYDFDFDENVLETAVRFYLKLTEKIHCIDTL